MNEIIYPYMSVSKLSGKNYECTRRNKNHVPKCFSVSMQIDKMSGFVL